MTNRPFVTKEEWKEENRATVRERLLASQAPNLFWEAAFSYRSVRAAAGSGSDR